MKFKITLIFMDVIQGGTDSDLQALQIWRRRREVWLLWLECLSHFRHRTQNLITRAQETSLKACREHMF